MSASSGSPQLYCLKHTEHREPLVHVCMSPLCHEKPMLCVSCIKEQHRDHDTISLNTFLEEIDSCRYDTTLPDASSRLRDAAKQGRVATLRQLQQVKEKVGELLANVEAAAAQQSEATEAALAAVLAEYHSTIPEPLALKGDQSSIMINVSERHKSYFANKNLKSSLKQQFAAQTQIIEESNKALEEQVALAQKGVTDVLLKLQGFAQARIIKVSFETSQAALNSTPVYAEIYNPQPKHPGPTSANTYSTEWTSTLPVKLSKTQEDLLEGYSREPYSYSQSQQNPPAGSSQYKPYNPYAAGFEQYRNSYS